MAQKEFDRVEGTRLGGLVKCAGATVNQSCQGGVVVELFAYQKFKAPACRSKQTKRPRNRAQGGVPQSVIGTGLGQTIDHISIAGVMGPVQRGGPQKPAKGQVRFFGQKEFDSTDLTIATSHAKGIGYPFDLLRGGTGQRFAITGKPSRPSSGGAWAQVSPGIKKATQAVAVPHARGAKEVRQNSQADQGHGAFQSMAGHGPREGRVAAWPKPGFGWGAISDQKGGDAWIIPLHGQVERGFPRLVADSPQGRFLMEQGGDLGGPALVHRLEKGGAIRVVRRDCILLGPFHELRRNDRVEVSLAGGDMLQKGAPLAKAVVPGDHLLGLSQGLTTILAGSALELVLDPLLKTTQGRPQR